MNQDSAGGDRTVFGSASVRGRVPTGGLVMSRGIGTLTVEVEDA